MKGNNQQQLMQYNDTIRTTFINLMADEMLDRITRLIQTPSLIPHDSTFDEILKKSIEYRLDMVYKTAFNHCTEQITRAMKEGIEEQPNHDILVILLVNLMVILTAIVLFSLGLITKLESMVVIEFKLVQILLLKLIPTDFAYKLRGQPWLKYFLPETGASFVCGRHDRDILREQQELERLRKR